MASKASVSIMKAAERGTLRKYLNQYLKMCHAGEDDAPSNTVKIFPNLAGFCYFMGCGLNALTELQMAYPEEADYIRTVMEDALFHHPALPAGIAKLYMQARLGYTFPKKSRAKKPEQPMQIQVIYEPPSPEKSAEQAPAPEPAQQKSEQEQEQVPASQQAESPAGQAMPDPQQEPAQEQTAPTQQPEPMQEHPRQTQKTAPERPTENIMCPLFACPPPGVGTQNRLNDARFKRLRYG